MDDDPATSHFIQELNESGIGVGQMSVSEQTEDVIFLPVEVVELAPKVLGEDEKEIAGSEIPVTFPESNEIVEVS